MLGLRKSLDFERPTHMEAEERRLCVLASAAGCTPESCISFER